MFNRTTPELRKIFANLVKKGYNKSFIAGLFDTTRQTIGRWCNRIRKFKDKVRRAKEKITAEVELSVLAVRNTFHWGSARIQQGLFSLPLFMREKFKELNVKIAQNVKLSRTSINEVLKKHKINGYKRKHDSWQFFRAKKPNELWQLDIKGPFKVEGKKYYFVICIDDYSRYLVLAEQLDHCPSIEEICWLLESRIRKAKPKIILTDNNPFKEEWNSWCKEKNIKALHAHPYYPQDKGKVERAIRNVAEEFVYLLKKFPEWLDGKIRQYQKWYNEKRLHRGVKDYPANLYV
ncbi:MAG: DDE-type integrase/transposase/recombinase [Nanoarchaeota archaeon]